MTIFNFVDYIVIIGRKLYRDNYYLLYKQGTLLLFTRM